MRLVNWLRKSRGAGRMEYQDIAVVLPDFGAWLAYATICIFPFGLRIEERGEIDLCMYHRLGLCFRADGERFIHRILQARRYDDCTGGSLGKEVMNGCGAQSRRQKKYLRLISQKTPAFTKTQVYRDSQTHQGEEMDQ